MLSPSWDAGARGHAHKGSWPETATAHHPVELTPLSCSPDHQLIPLDAWLHCLLLEFK